MHADAWTTYCADGLGIRCARLAVAEWLAIGSLLLEPVAVVPRRAVVGPRALADPAKLVTAFLACGRTQQWCQATPYVESPI